MTLQTSFDMIDKILVINLKERTDRLEHIWEELNRVNMPPKKVEVIEGIPMDPGFMGCTKSHLKCLKLAREKQYKNVLILEDDFTIFDVDEFRHAFSTKITEFGEHWDVIMLSACILAKTPYSPFFDKISAAQTCSGYLVNHCFYDTLIQNFEECLVVKGYCDHYWKQLQPISRWFSFCPLLGYQYPNYSNNEKRFINWGC